jgi:transposase-like protein
MTSLNAKTEVLKQDARGRVRVTAQRREALLDEFERSGASAAKFARLVGIRYSTFANWVMQRRKRRVSAGKVVKATDGEGEAVAKAGPLRLLEAVLEGGSHEEGPATGSGGLVIELPGGSRLSVGSPVQLEMAAELVTLIAQRARARC